MVGRWKPEHLGGGDGTYGEGILMIEGQSDFVSKEEIIRAIEVGHDAVVGFFLGEAFRSRVCFL